MITRTRMPHLHLTPPPAKSRPPREPPRPPTQQQSRSGRQWWILPLLWVVILSVLLLVRAPSGTPRAHLSYSDFVAKVGVGQVKTIDINDKGAVSGGRRADRRQRDLLVARETVDGSAVLDVLRQEQGEGACRPPHSAP